MEKMSSIVILTNGLSLKVWMVSQISSFMQMTKRCLSIALTMLTLMVMKLTLLGLDLQNWEVMLV